RVGGADLRTRASGLRGARGPVRRADHAPPRAADPAPDARWALAWPSRRHGAPEGRHRAARIRAEEPAPGVSEGRLRSVRGSDRAVRGRGGREGEEPAD